MKKVLLALLLLLSLVLVSCSVEVAETTNEPLAYASLRRGLDKAVSTELVGPSFSELYFTYTASKADGGPTTGAKVEASLDTEETVGPFSVGYWDFTVTAYSDALHTNTVYRGSKEGIFLSEGYSNVIPITLHMVYDPGAANGSLDLQPLLKNLTPTTKIVAVLEAAELGFSHTYTVKNAQGGIDQVSSLIEGLRPGSYHVTLSAMDGLNTDFFSQNVLILNNVTTVIKGYYSYNNIYVSLSGPEDSTVAVLAGDAAGSSDIHYYINHVGAFTSVSTTPGNSQAMDASYASGQYFYKDGVTGQYYVLTRDQLSQKAYGKNYDALTDAEKDAVDTLGRHADEAVMEAARADEGYSKLVINTYEGYAHAVNTTVEANKAASSDASSKGFTFFLNGADIPQANKSDTGEALSYALSHGCYSYVQYIGDNGTIPLPNNEYLIGTMLTAVKKDGDVEWNLEANSKTYEIAEIGCDRHPGLFLNTDNIYVAKLATADDYARNYSKRGAYADNRDYYINHLGNAIYFVIPDDMVADRGDYYINSQGLFVAKSEAQNISTSSAAWSEWRNRGGSTAYINCYGLYTDVVVNSPSLARRLATDNSHSFYVQYLDYTTAFAPPRGGAGEKIGILLTTLPSAEATDVQKALIDKNARDLMEKANMYKVIDRNPNLFLNSRGVFEAVTTPGFARSGNDWALSYSNLLHYSYYVADGRVFTYIASSSQGTGAVITAVRAEGRSWYVDTNGVYHAVLSDVATAHVASLNGKATYIKMDGTTGTATQISGLTTLGYYQAEGGEDLNALKARAAADGQAFFLDEDGYFHSVAEAKDGITHVAAIYSGAKKFASAEVSEKYLTGEFDKATFLSSLLDTGYEEEWKD